MPVYIDARWPIGTGIGRMVDMYRSFAPPAVELRDLDIETSIGSPFSPLAVTRALRSAGAHRGRNVFWNPGFIPPLPGVVRSVVTIHDLTHLHHYTRAHRAYYDFVLKPLYARCDLIVCISEYTRNEFLEWSGMPDERVIVVPNAIDPGFSELSPPLQTDAPFIFYAGNRRPFKNVPLIVRAFVASRLATEGFHLVLTGPPDPQLQRIAADAGVSNALRFVGFLDDRDIVAHYKAAACVAFVSLYEGFGLPILEAFQCGTPILLSNATSFPEVAGDAAMFVEPNSLRQTAEAMRVLCLQTSVADELVRRGRERLALFDPRVSAKQLWSAIDEVGSL